MADRLTGQPLHPHLSAVPPQSATLLQYGQHLLAVSLAPVSLLRPGKVTEQSNPHPHPRE